MIPELQSHPDVVAEIVSDVVALNPQFTDWVEGSGIRSIIDAFAMLMIRLQHALVSGLRTGMQVGTFRNFDFPRLPAQPATGTVTLTRSNTAAAVTVSAGAQFGVPGATDRVYESIADVPMAIGVASVDLAVRCQTAGTVGRTAAATITQIISSLGFSATVTNARAILNGSNEETLSEQAERFLSFVASFSRGTKDALAYAAKTVVLTDSDGNIIEHVEGVLVREPFRDDDPPGPVGLVQVYVDNGSGAASADLVTKVQNTLRGYTENGVVVKGWISAGVDLLVSAVVGQALDVTVTVRMQAGFDKDVTKTAVQVAIGAYLQSLPVFGSAIVSEIVAAAMSVDGVMDVTVVAPTANVTPATISRIVPGVVTVQEMA